MVKFYQRIVRETRLSEERIRVHLERCLLSSHPSLHSGAQDLVTAAFPKDVHTVYRSSERALTDYVRTSGRSTPREHAVPSV